MVEPADSSPGRGRMGDGPASRVRRSESLPGGTQRTGTGNLAGRARAESCNEPSLGLHRAWRPSSRSRSRQRRDGHASRDPGPPRTSRAVPARVIRAFRHWPDQHHLFPRRAGAQLPRRVRSNHFGSGEAETTADVQVAAGTDGLLSAAVESTLGSDDARRRDALFTAARLGEAATTLDRRASPTMNGLRRSGQLTSLPLARRLSVVSAERRRKGVRRGVAGPGGYLGEGQLAGPQVVAGEGHPPVC
jgi:hypothetical protein